MKNTYVIEFIWIWCGNWWWFIVIQFSQAPYSSGLLNITFLVRAGKFKKNNTSKIQSCCSQIYLKISCSHMRNPARASVNYFSPTSKPVLRANFSWNQFHKIFRENDITKKISWKWFHEKLSNIKTSAQGSHICYLQWSYITCGCCRGTSGGRRNLQSGLKSCSCSGRCCSCCSRRCGLVHLANLYGWRQSPK